MRGWNDGLLVPIHHHAQLRHGGEAGGARIEQHTIDNRLVDKPAIIDLAREIRQKLGAGVAGGLALASRLRLSGGGGHRKWLLFPLPDTSY